MSYQKHYRLTDILTPQTISPATLARHRRRHLQEVSDAVSGSEQSSTTNKCTDGLSSSPPPSNLAAYLIATTPPPGRGVVLQGFHNRGNLPTPSVYSLLNNVVVQQTATLIDKHNVQLKCVVPVATIGS